MSQPTPTIDDYLELYSDRQVDTLLHASKLPAFLAYGTIDYLTQLSETENVTHRHVPDALVKTLGIAVRIIEGWQVHLR